jgi:hypothetical protein
MNRLPGLNVNESRFSMAAVEAYAKTVRFVAQALQHLQGGVRVGEQYGLGLSRQK